MTRFDRCPESDTRCDPEKCYKGSNLPLAAPCPKDEREELRRLIDVIEKSSGSGSLEQAVDDIKTFANTASFLTNKLDTKLKSGKVSAKSKPKSRVGKAIASVPKPNMPKSPSSPPDPSSTNTSGMPTATSIATSQADFERLKPQRSQPPVGAS